MPLPDPAQRPSARRFVGGALLALFALTGCNALGGETVIEPSTESAAAANTSVASDTATSTEPPTAEAPATAASEVVDMADEVVVIPDDVVVVDASEAGEVASDVETASFEQVTGANCMEGVWVSRPGEFGKYMAKVGELTGVEMQATGTVTVALQHGRYIYSTETTTNINIDGVISTSVVDGITQGSYEYDNGFIVAEQDFAEITAYVDVLGTRIDAADLGEDFNAMAALHQVPFDCGTTPFPVLWFETLPGEPRFGMEFEVLTTP